MPFDEPKVTEFVYISFLDLSKIPLDGLIKDQDELSGVSDDGHFALPLQGCETETNAVYCA